MTGCLIVSSRVLLTSPFCPVPVYISNAILVREVFTMVYATLPAMLPGCFSSQAMAQMKPNNSRAMAVQALFFGIPRAAK